MTELEWQDRAFADEWAARDVLRDLLDFPRRISSVVVGQDGSPRRVADIGSGPGDFLARFLDDFPTAKGIWTDASEAMRDTARDRLARFAGRVEYHIVYMEDLGPLPGDLDVLLTSRASHHLRKDALYAFYAAAAGKLNPGGWLINLDHTDVGGGWDERLKAARRTLIPPSPRPAEHPHRHDHPRPAADDHLDALRQAGLTDVAMPWRSFMTCLFMARKDGTPAGA